MDVPVLCNDMAPARGNLARPRCRQLRRGRRSADGARPRRV